MSDKLMPIYKAIVVSKEQLCAEGFSQLLKIKNKNFSHVESCFSIEDAKQKMQEQEYDFLFTSILEPENIFNEFIAYSRNSFSKLIIIIVNPALDSFAITGFFRMGINAYLAYSAYRDELETAIEKTLQGERYISREAGSVFVSAIHAKENSTLTKKELEVLHMVVQGLSISEAANRMQRSQHTIIGHRRNIMQKLGLHSAPEIVKYAYEHNLI
jgi:DNA-binding NarL/FixJ family response regulator